MFTMFWDFSKANLTWKYRPKITPWQHAQWGWLDQHHLYRHRCFKNTIEAGGTAEEDNSAGKVHWSDTPVSHHSWSFPPVSADHNIALVSPETCWRSTAKYFTQPPRIPLRDCWRKSLGPRITYRWAKGWALHSRGPGSVAEQVSS